MVKKVFFMLLLCVSCFAAYTQTLEVRQDLSYDAPCTDGESNACVLIIADTSLLTLTFYSDIDPDDGIQIVSINSVGSNTLYTLSFMTGSIFAKRILEIYSPICKEPARIPFYLQPKESRKYYVSPTECYNVHLKDAANLFQQSAYLEAKEEYKKAQGCFDAQADSEVATRITTIDSILFWRKIADASFDLLDYREARDYYNKIGSYNPQDDYAISRSKESSQKHNQYCFDCYSKAEIFFNTNEHEQAKVLYSKVISQNCQQRYDATSRLRDMIADSIKRLDRATVLTYEIADKVPLGFSIGGYRSKKGGGYFTLKTNPAFFNFLRSNYKKAVHPELNVSAGGNFRPVKNQYAPIWINIGIGYTGVSEYHYKLEDNDEEIPYGGEDLPKGVKPSSTIYHAVSPEIGLLGKIPLGETARVSIAVRYTFQYRFAINLDAMNNIESTAHGFGVGICF